MPKPPPELASRHVNSPATFVADGVSAPVEGGWLTEFDDDVLVDLVEEALRDNPDLYTAAARFAEARALLRVAGSRLRPQVDAVGGVQRADSGLADPATGYDLGLQVGWEVDLWGRLRANRALAEKIAEAAGLDYVQARHSLAALTAEAYFAVTTAAAQLEIDRALLASEQFTAQTTRQRVEAGVALPLDEDVAVANVALAETAIQQSQLALEESRRALEVLLGRYPAATIHGGNALPAVPALTGVGVPAGLLERRPDVLAAEQRVSAAFYDVEQAEAARLPSLTLGGAVGTLIDPDELFWSIAGNVFGPLYTGGRLAAEVEAASARQRQALGQYASVALEAFREVETALANEVFLAAQEAQLSTASQRLRSASSAAENRYQGGVMTILELNQVRRQDFQTRSQLLGVQFERLRQRLNLYLALGGTIQPVAPADVPADAPARADDEQDDQTQEIQDGR